MQRVQNLKWKIMLILSIVLFGTIGLFRRYIPWPSGVLSCFRGLFGGLFLYIYYVIKKKTFKMVLDKKDFLLIALSGALIGINWIMVFEAYNYTTVAITNLCYNSTPIFLLIMSFVIFKRKSKFTEILCIFIAFVGVILISGVLRSNFNFAREGLGVLLALGSAVFYASVIILNQYIRDVDIEIKTIIQLFFAGIFSVPHALIGGEFKGLQLDIKTIIIGLVFTVLITSVIYLIYFYSVVRVDTSTIAIFSYLDPFVAVCISVFILKEGMHSSQALGSILIISAVVFSEILAKKNN